MKLSRLPIVLAGVLAGLGACDRADRPPPSRGRGAAAPAASEAGPEAARGEGSAREPAPTPSREVLEVLELPPPRMGGEVSVEEALARRRSVREHRAEPLGWPELSQLLWAAQGVTADWGARTSPSAGATHPLELYLVTREGLYRYLPDGHRVELLSRDDRLRPLARTGQRSVIGGAPASLVFAGVRSRIEPRYRERAWRYLLIEAGHACQNVLLQAVALDLAAVPVGAFDDAGVSRALGLPPDHEPLYIVPVGRPRAGGEG